MPTTTIYTSSDITFNSGGNIKTSGVYCPTCSYIAVGYELPDPTVAPGGKNTPSTSSTALDGGHYRLTKPAAYPTGWFVTAATVQAYMKWRAAMNGSEWCRLYYSASTATEASTGGAPTGTLLGYFNDPGNTNPDQWIAYTDVNLATWVKAWIDDQAGVSPEGNAKGILIGIGTSLDTGEDGIVLLARESGTPTYLQFSWTTPAPTAPGAWSLPAGNVGVPKGTVVTLDFADAGTNGGPAITGYTIERRLNGGAWTTHSTPASSSGTFDTALFAAGVYEFRAFASNAYEMSAAGPTSPAVTVLVGPPRTMPGS